MIYIYKMPEYICQHCNSVFANKSNLNYHLKTNKRCKVIRGEEIINTNICDICNKSFTTKANLNTHIKTCKEEKDKLTNTKENQIQELTNKINELMLQLQDKDKKIDELTIHNKKQSKKIITLKNIITKKEQEFELKFEKQKEEYKIEHRTEINELKEEYKTDHRNEVNKLKEEYEIKFEKLKEEYKNELKNNKTNVTNNYIKNITNIYLQKLDRIDLKDMNIPRNDINYLIYKDPKQIPRLLANHLANETFLRHKVIRTDINRNIVLYLEKSGYKKDINGREIVNYMFNVYNLELIEQLNSIIRELADLDDNFYIEDIKKIFNNISNNVKDTQFFEEVCKEFIKTIPNVTDITRLQNEYLEDQPNSDKYITFKRDTSTNINNVTKLKDAKLKEIKDIKHQTKLRIKEKSKQKLEEEIIKGIEKMEEDHKYMDYITNSRIQRRLELEEEISILETEKCNIENNKKLTYDDRERIEKLNNELKKRKQELSDYYR